LGRGASVSFVMQSAGVAFKYLSSAALARWLGAASFGAYTYATNLSQLLATPCNLGGENSSLRFVPEYRAKGETGLLRGVLRAFRAVPLALGVLVAALAAAVVLVVGSGPTTTEVLLLALVAVPFFALVDVQTVIGRSFGSLFWALLPGLVLLPLALTVAVGAIVLGGHRPTATQTVLVAAAVVVAVAAFQAVVLRRVSRAEASSAPPRYDPRSWFRVSMPLLLVSSLNLVFQRVDVLLVGLFLDAGQAGVYAMAFRTAALASILQTAMNTTVAPRIASLFWSGRSEELEATVLRAIRLVFLPSLAVTVALVAFGGPILSLFGKSFRTGWAALAVYAVGQLVSVSNGPVGWLMNLTGHHSRAAVVNGVSAGLCLVGYLVLIPLFGLVGAAAANAGAVAVKNLWSNRVVRRRLGFRISVVRALTAPAPGAPS
ncbi:MAG TPA: oligosaccharide flippase family protein, partial [Acidimicrobiales bacterium]|nr:oligosaccharide flippase family protein [Acidimicrobiales bacterium]